MKKSKCEYCDKEFERPHGYRTETEAFHVHGCHLENIKSILNDKECDEFTKLICIDELKYISKVSSFGARPGSVYMERMKECDRLIKENE